MSWLSHRLYQEVSQAIKRVLQDHVNYRMTLPDDYMFQIIFDDERGQYLVLDMGWSNDKYLHATPIHISLIDHRVWIQYSRSIAVGSIMIGLGKTLIDWQSKLID